MKRLSSASKEAQALSLFNKVRDIGSNLNDEYCEGSIPSTSIGFFLIND